ncbi:MAG: hypothetical protein VX265_17470, partial [Myxococcota bacterium]|nr:hypothetical protein [Myxococcota bacterium]
MSHRAPILIALCIPACVSSNEPGHPAGADPLPPALPALDTGASGLVAQWTVRPESVRDLGQAGRAFGRRGAADWRLHAGGFIAELDPAGARMAPVGAPDAAVQVALAEAGRGDRREALPQGGVSGVEGDDGVGLIEHDRGSLVEWWRGGTRGLEHGWTLLAAPEGDGPLSF